MSVQPEYIKVNKTAIQERINNLEESLRVSEANKDTIRAGIEYHEIEQLKWVLKEAIVKEENK